MPENKSVMIYGKTYQVKSESEVDPEGLASFVDSKMSELAKVNVTQSTQDLAVLTALNLAGELEQEKEAAKVERGAIQRKMEALVRMLSEELKSIRS